jgi:hypothetical protein
MMKTTGRYTASRNGENAQVPPAAPSGPMDNPLARLKAATGGTRLEQRARRGKDPAAAIRRQARKALGIGDIRTADAATIRRLKKKGLLPGVREQLQGKAGRTRASTASSGSPFGVPVVGDPRAAAAAAVAAGRKKKKDKKRGNSAHPQTGHSGGSD